MDSYVLAFVFFTGWWFYDLNLWPLQFLLLFLSLSVFVYCFSFLCLLVFFLGWEEGDSFCCIYCLKKEEKE